MRRAINWLVFDLGGVLVDVAPGPRSVAARARRSATPRKRLEPLLRAAFDPRPYSLVERFQTGELDAAGFVAALNAELEQPLAFEDLRAELEAMLLGEKAQSAALIERLASGHPIACYSNTNATHWHRLRRGFAFFDHIERAFASQEVGYAKPDARGFDAVAAALVAEPACWLLIDDRPLNVDGARAAGWRALSLVDAATLERDLAGIGITAAAACA